MRVLVTGRLPGHILAMLEKEHTVEINSTDRPMSREQILVQVNDKQGLLCMITDRIDCELIDRASRLKIIANCGVGFNNIDIRAAAAKSIPVTNTPDVLTDATADLTFALILAVSRRIVEGDKKVRAGRFDPWAPLYFLGQEVSGKTLGIIGLGRIGEAVAKRAAGFGMQIFYYKQERLDTDAEKNLGVVYAPMEKLLSESDFISLHVPLTAHTRHLVGEKELNLMKASAYLVNTSRGPVVDEKALLKALENKRIQGAGMDVYENEPELTPGLTALDNVVLLPHMGSATIETRTQMARLAVENLLAGLRGEVPPNCVNSVQ